MQGGRDTVIIGSGLGGLMCGAILAKNGFKVTILEKNNVFGGCLQSYKRDGVWFDTGVHYIGGIHEGGTLNKIFTYLGIMPKLKLKQLDPGGFDIIKFGDNEIDYPLAQTYEGFIDKLAIHFPNERDGIEKYCTIIKQTCEKFPLYNLEKGGLFTKLDMLETSIVDVINSCVESPLLRKILAGNNPLYAGQADKTPFYIHALILNSYIQGAYRCEGAGQVIADQLSEIIKEFGGQIITKANVVHINIKDGKATQAKTEDGREFTGNYFISDIHPAITIHLTKGNAFRKAYGQRIQGLKNTIGAFILNVVFKESKFATLNHNVYYYSTPDCVWNAINYESKDWPMGYVLFITSEQNGFAKSASIMSYIDQKEFHNWQDTFNTIFYPGDRGKGYLEFKDKKANLLLDVVQKKFPEFRNAIDSYHTITPLTYRDYTNTPDGSLYGIQRDYRDPLKTFIPSRTRIPNLLLTGQNLNIHGVLGVSVSSLITTGELIDLNLLLDQIKSD